MHVTRYTYRILHSILPPPQKKKRKLENTKFLTEKFSEFLDLLLNRSMPIQNPRHFAVAASRITSYNVHQQQVRPVTS